MKLKKVALLAACAVTGLWAAGIAPARAEDCTGILPGANCTLDQNTTASLTVSNNVLLTVSAGALASPLVIGHTIDPDNGIAFARMATAGNGGTIWQEADIGVFSGWQVGRLTINAGDVWYLSNNAALSVSSALEIDGGVFGIGPDSALSYLSHGINGGSGNDTIDYISGGVSFGTTGTISRAGDGISLGDGADVFIYYQSADSTINADFIFMGNDDDLMALRGDMTDLAPGATLFAGDFLGGGGNDSLVFVSSSAAFGSLTSNINMGDGDDVIDFDSGGGVAAGILRADTMDLYFGSDTIHMADNAAIEIGTSFDGNDGNDVIDFTSGGLIEAAGAAFSMGDGDDLIEFNDIVYASNVRGLDVSGGSFTMGGGNDRIRFNSAGIGLNATGTTVNLGSGDDEIVFVSTGGALAFVSGAGFLSIDGGAGTDSVFFGSAMDVTFGAAGEAGSITTVEILDIGDGTLTYVGAIDASASIVNFLSAGFYEAGTDILAFLSGDAGTESVLFASGAQFSGMADLNDGADSMTFSSAVLAAAATVDLGNGDDTFNAGSDATIAGTVDGGSDANDALTFTAGLTTLTGSITGFTSAQILAGGTLNIRDAGSLPIDVYGAGTLQFGSAGSTASTYSITNTIDGVSLEIAGDTVDTNGINLGATTALSALTVGEGALLLADSNIISGGALDVDGTLRLTADASIEANSYTANPGTFIFEIDRSGGVTDMAGLTFTGGGAIDFAAAGDTFQFVLGPVSGPLVTDTVLFISGAGALTAPTNIIGDTILYDLSVVNAGANALELQIQELNTIAGLSNSQNNENIGTVLLVDLLNSTDSGINAIQSEVLGSNGRDDFNFALEAASPIINRGEMEAAHLVSRRSFGLINQRLAMLRKDAGGETGISSGDLVQELEAWWQFFAGSGDQNPRDFVSGYDSTTYGMAGGVDKELFEDGFFGLSFTWADTGVNSKGAGDAETLIDTYQLGLYGDYDFGRAYINTALAYGYNDIYTAKNSAAGQRTANFHANHYTARAEVGAVFMPGKTRIIPKLMTHYSYYDPAAYTEEGPGGQEIGGDALKIFEVGAGVDFSWLIRNDAESFFVPELRLAYRHDLSDQAVASTAQFVAGGPDFTVQGFDPAENAFDIGVGITYFSKDEWELLLNYDAEIKEDYLSQTGMIRAAYKFLSD